MKVIEGAFGKPKEVEGIEKPTLLEAITSALKESGLDGNTKGTFFMVMDVEERIAFLTNQDSISDTMMLIEVAKGVLINAFLDRGVEE